MVHAVSASEPDIQGGSEAKSRGARGVDLIPIFGQSGGLSPRNFEHHTFYAPIYGGNLFFNHEHSEGIRAGPFGESTLGPHHHI